MIKNPFEIIKRPIITEKVTKLTDTQNKYVFEVNPKANKIQIRDAVKALVKEMFNKEVTVVRVNTLNVHPKKRRVRYRQAGYTSAWKKAVVTLGAGEKVEFF